MPLEAGNRTTAGTAETGHDYRKGTPERSTLTQHIRMKIEKGMSLACLLRYVTGGALVLRQTFTAHLTQPGSH